MRDECAERASKERHVEKERERARKRERAKYSFCVHSHIPRQLPHTHAHTHAWRCPRTMLAQLTSARLSLVVCAALSWLPLKKYMCVCVAVALTVSLCVWLSLCLFVCVRVSVRAAAAAAATETCEYKNKLNNISSRYTLPDRHCMRYIASGGSAAVAPTPPLCRQRRR